MSIRNRFSGKVAGEGALDCSVDGAGRTKQSMKEECDINTIMARYVRTGTVAHVAKYGGSYGFASAQSFQDAINVVKKAEQMFSELPAKVRARFRNQPAEFLAFVQDEKNTAEAVELGLAIARPKVEGTGTAVPSTTPTT